MDLLATVPGPDVPKHQSPWSRIVAVSLLAVSLLTVVTACSFLTSPKREVSKLFGTPPLEAPPTVKVDETFVVTVGTIGGGHIMTDDTEVRVSGLVAEITPYDHVEQSRVVRHQLSILVHRTVRLRFASPGLATIRAIGQGLDGQRATVETHVVVCSQ